MSNNQKSSKGISSKTNDNLRTLTDGIKKNLNKARANKSFGMEYGKVQPQAVDLEEAVLGAIILERDSLLLVIDSLKPETFYVDAHQKIYAAILKLFNLSEKIDLLTVIQKLKDEGNLSLVGGAYYMTELTNRVASSAHIEYHAKIIQQQWLKREIIRVCSETTRAAFTDTEDVFEVLDDHEHQIFKLRDPIHKRDVVRVDDAVTSAMQDLTNAVQSESGITGVPSGLTDVDKRMFGWQPSDLIILAGRPGMGKTAFVLQMAKNAAIDFRVPTAVFSLEMSTKQLTFRLMANQSQLPLQMFIKADLEVKDWAQLNDSIKPLLECPLWIDDTPGLAVMELRAKCRRLKANHDIQLIIVDYIQLMTGEKTGNREQEIGSISRALKLIAKELDVPVIALSQLSREVEKRGGNKKPMLSDLRESGCLTGDTPIFCNKLQKIETLEGQTNFDLFAHDKGINQIMKAKKSWETGTKPILKMTLNTGHEIKATANHKFLTLDGWKELGDISEKSKVAIPLNWSNNNEDYHPEVAYLMGAMIANGKTLKRQAITYTCCVEDNDLAHEIKRISEKHFECLSRVVDNRPKYNWINAYIKSERPISRYHRNPFVKFIDEQGIYNKTGKFKHLPESIWRQNENIIVNMLAGLFDNDGCIYASKDLPKFHYKITYSTASLQLANDVQLCLQMVGLVSSVAKVVNNKYMWYTVSLSNKESTIKFIDKIPLKSKRKNEIAARLKKHLSGMETRKARNEFNENRSLCFIPVKNIVNLERNEKVYDIEVPNSHNFIAAGILCHNSIEQDADIVGFIYRPEYYDIMEDEEGNSLEGIVEFIISKFRNGTAGTDKLKFIGKFQQFTDYDDNGLTDKPGAVDITTPITPDPLGSLPDGFDHNNAPDLDFTDDSAKKKPEDNMPF